MKKVGLPEMRAAVGILFLLVFTSLPAKAKPTIIESHLSDPGLVGQARLKVMLWNVFDADLYAEDGTYDKNEAFALTLTYLRTLKGEKIVEKSMQEIRRLASGRIADARLSEWRNQLLNIIPDVTSGMSITGVRTDEGHTVLYRENDMLGTIADRDFTELFFSIWLSEKSSEPELRSRLLGLDRTS